MLSNEKVASETSVGHAVKVAVSAAISVVFVFLLSRVAFATIGHTTMSEEFIAAEPVQSSRIYMNGLVTIV